MLHFTIERPTQTWVGIKVEGAGDRVGEYLYPQEECQDSPVLRESFEVWWARMVT